VQRGCAFATVLKVDVSATEVTHGLNCFSFLKKIALMIRHTNDKRVVLIRPEDSSHTHYPIIIDFFLELSSECTIHSKPVKMRMWTGENSHFKQV